MSTFHQTLVEIDPRQIQLNPYQPRKGFAPEELEGLAQSICNVGLLHPPLVRQMEGDKETFELISGERRVRAAQIAGLKTIPVVVMTSGHTKFSAEASLIENIQRVDLNSMDIAKALQLLILEFGYIQEDLANRIGKKRSTVANYLRLLSLPKDIQDGIEAGMITMGHAKAILSLPQVEKQLYLYGRIVKERMSVREAEKIANKIGEIQKRRLDSHKTYDCFLNDLQVKLEQKLGTKVTFQGEGNKGRLCIDYYNLDDLERLLVLFGI